MSRIASIQTAGESTPNAAYSYLGADQIVTEDYQQPQIKLDYSAGSHDRRLEEFRQSRPVRPGCRSDLVLRRQRLGQCRHGRRLRLYVRCGEQPAYRHLPAGTSFSLERDVRLRQNRSSDLGHATRSNGQSQTWTLDSLGNIISSSTNGTNQTETVDSANEIQSLSGAATPGYDRAGNMTTTPGTGFAEHRADGRVRRLESVGECVGRFGQRYLPVRRLGPVGG